MPETQLPTIRDVIRDFYYQKGDTKSNKTFNELKDETIQRIVELYLMVPQATINVIAIETKLKKLLDDFSKAKKFTKKSQKVSSFVSKLDTLFDISSCKCKMIRTFSWGLMNCSCKPEKRIHEAEFDFIFDQRGVRQMYLAKSIDFDTTAKYIFSDERRVRYACSKNANNNYPVSSNSTSNILTVRTRSNRVSYEEYFVHGDNFDEDSSDDDFVVCENNTKFIKLMNTTQGQTADRKGISNRALSEVLTNNAKLFKDLNENENIKFHGLNYTTVFRHRIKERNQQVECLNNLISSHPGPFQLMFDGKKINDKERLVIIVQYLDEEGVRQEKFIALKTFDEDESITGENVFETMVDKIFDNSFLVKVFSTMSDTTGVNHGPRKGINARLQVYFKSQLGHELHTFECMLHVNELYLSHTIKLEEGGSKAANRMSAGSVYNLIEDIDNKMLTEQNLQEKTVNIGDQAKSIIDKAINLASTWKEEGKESVFRGDHIRLLVLAAKTYRQIPGNLKQYLFHRQEVISQARWCTTASGYLRIFHFHLFDLDETQEARLERIIEFVVNVYVVVFITINLHPSVPEAPSIVILTRDLMKSINVADKVKEIFLNHASKWLSPINVAVAVHQNNPAINIEELKYISVNSVNTRELCWSDQPLKSFFTSESSAAPCITAGSSIYWQSLDNHNRSCERYIGKMGLVFKNGWVRDNSNSDLDNRVRGYVLSMEAND